MELGTVGIGKGTLQPGILGTLNVNLAAQFIKKGAAISDLLKCVDLACSIPIFF